jgi:hypothetical protein
MIEKISSSYYTEDRKEKYYARVTLAGQERSVYENIANQQCEF